MRLLKRLGLKCPVPHDSRPAAKSEPRFLEAMVEVCTALAHPGHRDLLRETMAAWIEKHPDLVRGGLSESIPGGRLGPWIRGAMFAGDAVVALDDMRVDLEKLMLEILKLNAIDLWRDLLDALEAAGDPSVEPPPRGLRAPAGRRR